MVIKNTQVQTEVHTTLRVESSGTRTNKYVDTNIVAVPEIERFFIEGSRSSTVTHTSQLHAIKSFQTMKESIIDSRRIL